MFSLVVRMVQDPAVAEEIAQEAFLKVFRSLDTYDPSRKLSSWIFKIAHNTTLDHLRRRHLDTVPLEGSEEEDEPGVGHRLSDDRVVSPRMEAESSELARAMEEAVSRLRPEYREVVVLRFQEGMAYQEIADITGLPMGTVKTYIFRARKELARHLTEMGWTP